MDAITLRRLQRFHAEAIPANAIRNQGAKGVLKAIRDHLACSDLATLVTGDDVAFARRLQRATSNLMRRLPEPGRHWGAARKALNLFLRDCTYDHHLRIQYRLDRIERWLEIPLDSNVAKALRREPEGTGLPRWDSLCRLAAKTSAEYQAVAQCVARRKRIRRVHLDLYYWRANR